MSIRLRDLIKAVRACKTAAEERAVIAKESALIRTAIKEDDNDHRHRNVAKLLYIQMLGYPTQFGQMECLKLIASSFYTDKRVGYLGLMLLLDENQEILTLITNHMKNDLVSQNQFISGLALCALGNISSSGMARDLAPEVEKLLANPNSYLRKKAALCAIRILRKCPDLMENFVPRIRSLISERNHGVLLTAVSLMSELCESDPQNVEFFRRLVPSLVKTLKGLVMSQYTPEYDVAGITDPFLQVKLLKLLRILGKGDAESSDAMNDVLAQVATNTDHTRNVGNAILYECVLTIMTIDADSGLRVLAVNVLGRFLQNKDNNIRYVALNTLSKVVGIDLEAVQRHRTIIVDCLKDPDISIRKRALELIYSLVNENNIKVLAVELINFLQNTSYEFRPDLTVKLCTVTEKYAPDQRWHVDTILKILSIAGDYVPDEVTSNLVTLIGSSSNLHFYAVQKFYEALITCAPEAQPILTQISLWIVGEFGDVLVSYQGPDRLAAFQNLSEEAVVDSIVNVIQLISSSAVITKEYGLTALIKLSVRFSQSQSKLKNIIQSFKSNIQVELQQRACEYSSLFDWIAIRKEILDRIPIEQRKSLQSTSTTPSSTSASSPSTSTPATSSVASKAKDSGSTLIEWDDIPSSVTPASPVIPADHPLGSLLGPSTTTVPPPTTTTTTTTNLLEGLFGTSSLGHTPSTPTPTPGPGPAPSLLGSLLEMGGPTSPTSPVVSHELMGGMTSVMTSNSNSNMTLVALDSKGLQITFEVVKQPSQPNVTVVNASFINKNSFALNEFDFKVAVPKYLKLQVNPPSGTVIMPGTTVQQSFKFLNTMHGEKAPVVKIKVDYSASGVPVSEIGDVKFPSGI